MHEEADGHHLESEDVAAIDKVLHHLLVVLHLGGGQCDCELGCASRRDDLHRHDNRICRWHLELCCIAWTRQGMC